MLIETLLLLLLRAAPGSVTVLVLLILISPLLHISRSLLLTCVYFLRRTFSCPCPWALHISMGNGEAICDNRSCIHRLSSIFNQECICLKGALKCYYTWVTVCVKMWDLLKKKYPLLIELWSLSPLSFLSFTPHLPLYSTSLPPIIHSFPCVPS